MLDASSSLTTEFLSECLDVRELIDELYNKEEIRQETEQSTITVTNVGKTDLT